MGSEQRERERESSQSEATKYCEKEKREEGHAIKADEEADDVADDVAEGMMRWQLTRQDPGDDDVVGVMLSVICVCVQVFPAC